MTPAWASDLQQQLDEPWKGLWSDELGGLLIYDADSDGRVVAGYCETRQRDLLEELSRGLMICAHMRREHSLQAVARVLLDIRGPVGCPPIEQLTVERRPVAMFEWTDGVRSCVTWVVEDGMKADLVCEYWELGLTTDIDAEEIVRAWTCRNQAPAELLREAVGRGCPVKNHRR